ncbi:bifunctional glutamate N-acetyltransferase/amino-acid acetyltransferase ArgJ [Granulosicoccus antarcticus]|uniref:Arginine biosynthesis bifunctional protein ArgJ n=1 Tax=Granulosicoccus antarcticus IMCC3135 TaxID=1192854 RepID=A0A2Z2P5B5_9GAMM|nr:bifunctional glutamate N-acetyltransferase/amino-acid acetyltransferase ArgJ [Granulosicoccus antarcticus]ASJ75877.1 Arginine biosynthesis bifunctional protein ArgJ [Granulosicoccus antarcticus IMCC3135]
MPVNLNLPSAMPVRGAVLTTLVAGLKSSGTADMVVAQLAETARTAAVFTQNAFCAAPVTIGKEHLLANKGHVRALLINSGNANAGTGQPGIDMARGHCQALAAALEIPEESVLPFSTGVIGQLLPDAIMRNGIEKAAQTIASAPESEISQWTDASRGIMTTDTQPKLTSQTVLINGQSVTITGMSKGAGMIQPNMATMLSYVFTDATIDVADLNTALHDAVDVSFNAITVDSDTSTNDACVLVATGVGEALDVSHAQWPDFMHALRRVCMDLAQAIIRDAEGATKFITVKVTGGKNTVECKQVGYSIANSPLVKTAMFASDANVGRLLMAIGKAGVDALDASKVTVSLGDVVAFSNAGIAEGYTEERGAAVLAKAEIDVIVDLARGDAAASIYTCDLSHDYVSINADYRS